ncbi:retrovirus-related pol polyprotein from transposon TNT 1-94 [Tanacetum coccineum]
MRPAQALTAIQTMADHSQKWHDETTSRNIRSSSSKDGLAALVNKLDNLGRDMKKLKESVHAIQDHLDTIIRFDDCPPYGEKRQSLEELLAKHQEESARRSTEMEGWIKRLHENAEINTRNQNASLKNLETQIEQLTEELRSIKEKSEQTNVVINEHKGPNSPKKIKNLHGISFLSDSQEENTNDQIPTKESNPGHFTLPCTIGNFNFYAMADLGASVNVLPRNIFEYLELTNLSETEMLVEMEDMRKKAPLGIVRDILVKIDKFLFPSDFVIIDQTSNSTVILGRPFLATIHAQISVFEKETSVGIGTKMPSEYQQDYKKTRAYAPKNYNDLNRSNELKDIYRTLESKYFHEGRTIDPSFYNDLSDDLVAKFTAIGICIYSDAWGLDELEKTLEKIKPYNSRLLAIDDIRNLIHRRTVHEKVDKEGNIIHKFPKQIKTNELFNHLRPYELVIRKMSSLKAKQPKKPPPKRARYVGKSKHTQLSTLSLTESPPSDNGDLPSTKLSPRSHSRALKDDPNMCKEQRETRGMFKNLGRVLHNFERILIKGCR